MKQGVIVCCSGTQLAPLSQQNAPSHPAAVFPFLRWFYPGLLMRLGHTETKAKTETTECETEIETETETKNLL